MPLSPCRDIGHNLRYARRPPSLGLDTAALDDRSSPGVAEALDALEPNGEIESITRSSCGTAGCATRCRVAPSYFDLKNPAGGL
jgi:hypothetical protein